MFPVINFGLFELPTYGLLAIVGFLLALLVATSLSSRCGMPKQDIVFASLYCVMGIAVGAKILYFITVLPRIIKYIDYFNGNVFLILIYGFSGFVFYGGLIGGALGVILYCKQFHIQVSPIMNVVAPAIPLFHAFGRIGCFLGGCCYGIEYHGPLAVLFPYSTDISHLADVPRLPIQLIESSFNFVLFIVIFIFVKRGKPKTGQALGLYLMAYPVARFILEFFRGDNIRGLFFGLSTSQWISLLLLPLGIYLFLKKEKQTTNC